jgi:hypothetical protein
LSYTWGDSGEVTFELSPVGDKVRLVITGRRTDPTEDVGAAAGWGAHWGILEGNVNGVAVRPFWSNWLRLNEHFERRFGNA